MSNIRSELLSAAGGSLREEVASLANRLSSVPTPNSTAKMSPDEGISHLRSSADGLSDKELTELNTYYASEVGKIDRLTAQKAVSSFSATYSRKPSNAKPQALRLLALHKIDEVLAGLKGPLPVTNSQLHACFVDAYSHLPDATLEEMIAFHGSSTGKRSREASQAAALRIANKFGL
ncbi:MAG: hypothetical protein WAU78_09680 [Roseiarcus sp.]